ncbi:hypothetical protein AWC17_25175 [Mycobacterium nebraskense]|uniref:DUF7159 domain-containing protein n=1 Tax=Mycobacterium nebraskense TaxID=244292 RepID=A0A1X1ZZH0_9MYCO|nr:hypothetical protein AWC17_25175 [Mycobacterium nebraskense]
MNAPEEPETALARGAALASANAPLFASSTAALAYAQDPDTGVLEPDAIVPVYGPIPRTAGTGDGGVAYSVLADDNADTYTAAGDERDFLTGAFAEPSADREEQGRRSLWLPGSAFMAVFVVGVVALVVALATSIRPTVHQQPSPGQNMVIPTKQAPQVPAVPAPAPAAPAPAPAPEVRVPAAPAPRPVPVAPVPAPVPVAPAVPPPPPAPPIVIPLPPIFGPPGHGGGGHGGGGHGGEGHGGEGHGGGGFGIPGIPGLPGFMH